MDPKALEAAFAQIRAAIDSAEREIMMSKRKPMEPETPDEEESEGESMPAPPFGKGP